MADRKTLSGIALPADPTDPMEVAARKQGLPAGGMVGRVLTKQSGTDYDGAWSAPPDPATRYNLCPNPSAETNITGWTGTTPLATVARSTSNPSPNSPANASSTASTTGTGTIRPPQCLGIEPDRAYTFSCWVRTSVARTVTPQIQFQDAANVNVGTAVSGSAVALSAATWTRVFVTATAPAGASRLQPIVSVASLASTNVVQVDEALIEPAPLMGAYFDGSDAGGTWSDTANNSTSTYVAPAPSMRRYRSGAHPALTNDSPQPIQLNTNDGSGTGLAASGNGIQVTQAGPVLVLFEVFFNGGGAGYRAVTIMVNGTIVRDAWALPSETTVRASGGAVIAAAANDVITIGYYVLSTPVPTIDGTALKDTGLTVTRL